MGDRELKKKSGKGGKSAIEMTVMDEKIWKQLPEEVLEDVIARLPLAKFTLFRVVCKGSNSLPKSPSFRKQWAQVAPQKLPFVFAMAHLQDGYNSMGMFEVLFDPLMKKWHYTNYTLPHERHNSVVASDGGLVCHLNHHHRPYFLVGNHLTQTWKEFPWSATTTSILNGFHFAVGLVDCSIATPTGAGGYKLLWVSSEGECQVYDSLKSGSSRGRMPSSMRFPCCLGVNTVTIGSVVCFSRFNPDDGIMSYDVVSGKWELFMFPNPPNWNEVALAECGGRLLLAGLVLDNNTASGFGVCVWEIVVTRPEGGGLSWREVDRMPSSWCRFKGKNAMFRFLCNRRLLVMSIWTSCRVDRIFMYDVISREWSKVPLCKPPGITTGALRVMAGVGFLPCFSASP